MAKIAMIFVLAGVIIGGSYAAVAGAMKHLAVYREDRRQDMHEITDPDLRRLADSNLALFPRRELIPSPKGYKYDPTPMREALNLCVGEKYAEQPAAASCSAVLIGEDLVYTAGHCINRKSCPEIALAFGYATNSAGKVPEYLATPEVYFCKAILARSNTDVLDYAVVRLDRPVKNHAPVKVAKDRIQLGEEIFMMGHPGGAPLKYSVPAEVRNVTKNHFTAELDALGGNSGSGVFSAKTRELVGILVAGEDDYVDDIQNNCRHVRNCEEDSGCGGEDSTHVDILEQSYTK